ncbi:MAG: hypothetical protein ACTSU5_09730 [Promethearchaeota archaeon]
MIELVKFILAGTFFVVAFVSFVVAALFAGVYRKIRSAPVILVSLCFHGIFLYSLFSALVLFAQSYGEAVIFYVLSMGGTAFSQFFIFVFLNYLREGKLTIVALGFSSLILGVTLALGLSYLENLVVFNEGLGLYLPRFPTSILLLALAYCLYQFHTFYGVHRVIKSKPPMFHRVEKFRSVFAFFQVFVVWYLVVMFVGAAVPESGAFLFHGVVGAPAITYFTVRWRIRYSKSSPYLFPQTPFFLILFDTENRSIFTTKVLARGVEPVDEDFAAAIPSIASIISEMAGMETDLTGSKVLKVLSFQTRKLVFESAGSLGACIAVDDEAVIFRVLLRKILHDVQELGQPWPDHALEGVIDATFPPP